LVHSLVDFGLRLPANLLLLMVLIGMLVASRQIGNAGSSRPLAGLFVLLLIAAVPVATNAVLMFSGGDPIDPRALAERAALELAENRDQVRALDLTRRALDRSPADREAHEMLATALGAGVDSDSALRRAIGLNPWASELRDRLARQLWARGDVKQAAIE